MIGLGRIDLHPQSGVPRELAEVHLELLEPVADERLLAVDEALFDGEGADALAVRPARSRYAARSIRPSIGTGDMEVGGDSRKVGRVRTCQLEPDAFRVAETWFSARRSAWERHLDALGEYLAAQDPPPPRRKS